PGSPSGAGSAGSPSRAGGTSRAGRTDGASRTLRRFFFRDGIASEKQGTCQADDGSEICLAHG
ncbi:hypothetical protein, partial [Cobetia sp.]